MSIHNIPLWIRPFYNLISFCIALFLYFLCFIIHFSCRIKFEGKENLSGNNKKIIPSNFFLLLTWDKKITPLPFSTIRVIYGKPIFVTAENIESSKKLIAEMLTHNL